MLAIKPKLRKIYKKINITSNHYDIKLNQALTARRYDLNFSSKSGTSQDQLDFKHIVSEFKEPLSQIFEWHSSSGKVLYSLNKAKESDTSPEGKNFKVTFLPDGTIDILKLLDDEMESSSTVEDEDLSESTLKLIPVGKELDLSKLGTVDQDRRSEMLQTFSICVSSLMSHLGLKEFGISGRFFDHQSPSQVSLGFLGNVDVLSGFKVSAGVYQSGIPKILVDWQSRIIRSRSLWDEYCDALDRGVKASQIESELIGRNYVNTINNRSTRIDGFDFKLTPESPHSEFETWGEFFKSVCGIKEIEDWSQPLAYRLVRKKVKGKMEKKPKIVEEKTYFLPEVLRGTGLTDQMKNDFRTMQNVSEFTKIGPGIRCERIQKMVKGMDSKTGEISDLFEVDFNSNSLQALQMPRPKVTFKKDTITPDRGNFFVKGQIYKAADIKRWAIIWERDENFAYDFSDELYKACERLGIMMDYPEMIALPDGQRKPDHIKKAVKQAYQGGADIIVSISDNITAKRGYKIYKDLCYKKYGVAHQNIRLNNKIFHGKKSRGIFDKIAIQMSTKMGAAPWKVQQPLEIPKGHKIMQIGADVFHSRGKESVASVVATLNRNFTKHVSLSRVQPKRGQEIMNNMSEMVLKAVEVFQKHNKFLPDTIVFFRDGVGKGQHDLIKEHEIKKIESGLDEKYGKKAPKLVFILVTKRINDRFFTKINNFKLDNPDSGMIVERKVTSNDVFDYFMVAQKVTQGTATPTHYEVIRNNSEFCADFFYTLTYFMTFNYFNWSGPVKVPSVCQYAHKQAYLLGENHLLKCGKEDAGIHRGMRKSLFYL